VTYDYPQTRHLFQVTLPKAKHACGYEQITCDVYLVLDSYQPISAVAAVRDGKQMELKLTLIYSADGCWHPCENDAPFAAALGLPDRIDAVEDLEERLHGRWIEACPEPAGPRGRNPITKVRNACAPEIVQVDTGETASALRPAPAGSRAEIVSPSRGAAADPQGQLRDPVNPGKKDGAESAAETVHSHITQTTPTTIERRITGEDCDSLATPGAIILELKARRLNKKYVALLNYHDPKTGLPLEIPVGKTDLLFIYMFIKYGTPCHSHCGAGSTVVDESVAVEALKLWVDEKILKNEGDHDHPGRRICKYWARFRAKLRGMVSETKARRGSGTVSPGPKTYAIRLGPDELKSLLVRIN
jgi:hypothetical protein